MLAFTESKNNILLSNLKPVNDECIAMIATVNSFAVPVVNCNYISFWQRKICSLMNDYHASSYSERI